MSENQSQQVSSNLPQTPPQNGEIDPLAFVQQKLQSSRKTTAKDLPQKFMKSSNSQFTETKEPAVIQPVPEKVESVSPSSENTPEATSLQPSPDSIIQELLNKKDTQQPVQPEETPEPTNTPSDPAETEEPLPTTPSGENFKKLRNVVKTLDNKYQAKIKELEDAQKKIKEYEDGVAIPQLLQEKESRIQELSYYEKLHNLKGSKEYREAYITPINERSNKLSTLAKEYEIPEEVLQSALNITNKRELNYFLSQHFDDVGALEARTYITEIRDLQEKARNAEVEPVKTLEALQAEAAKIEEQQRLKRYESFSTTAKNTWVNVLQEIKREGIALELIPKDNDPEHNKKFVEPILQKAATEYGRVVKLMAEGGLTSLPNELAHAIAKQTLLALASAVAMQSRMQHVERAEQLETKYNQVNQMLRPQIGQTSGHSSNYGNQPQSTLSNRIMSHLDNVLKNG